jgi:hypothetical protein
MTKKFWKDWQNRIGETKDIELNICVFNKNNARCYYHSVLSRAHGEDKILHASFHGDAVDLVIERHGWANGHTTVENEYLTLHRKEIQTIEFYKY